MIDTRSYHIFISHFNNSDHMNALIEKNKKGKIFYIRNKHLQSPSACFNNYDVLG